MIEKCKKCGMKKFGVKYVEADRRKGCGSRTPNNEYYDKDAGDNQCYCSKEHLVVTCKVCKFKDYIDIEKDTK